jgi:cell wall integrity and stress response component
MKTGLSSVAVLVAGLSSAIVLVSLAVGAQAADAVYYACYSAAGSMTYKAEDEFQSRGSCRTTCVDNATTNDNGNGYAVMGMTKGTLCYCGNLLPNDYYKVNDSKCKQPCGGFSSETCKTHHLRTAAGPGC